MHLRIASEPMDWGTLLGEFALHQRAAGLSEKTIQNRHECLSLCATRTGKTPLTVQKRDLLVMLTRIHPRTGEPISDGTKQTNRSYYQQFFRWLHLEGYRQDDPAFNLPKVKKARSKPRPFRVEQVDEIIDCGIYRRTRDIISIGALSGLRIGEIVKIRGEDIDWDGGILVSLRKGGLLHSVAMHPMLMELAKNYPRSGWWFPSSQPNEKFPNGDGHILMESASDRISKAIRAVGITDRRITAHSLRHYFASGLLRKGVDIRKVQEALGHASLATTQLYTEVTEDEVKEAVSLLPGIRIRQHSGRSRRKVPALSDTMAV